MGRRGRVVIGLVVLAVAIVVVAGAVVLSGGDDATPVGAVAAVQDDHLPVDPIDTIPDRLDMIAATGATTTRVDLFWKDIAPSRPDRPSDPADPAYDFSRADLIMLGLAKHDITPIVSVYNAPRWATGGPPSPAAVNPNAPDPKDFADFMGALAARYSGGFTSPGGEKLPEVRHYEIWNEPNLPLLLLAPVRGGRAGVAGRVRRDGQGGLPGDQEGQRRRRRDRRGGRPAQQHEPHRHRGHGLAEGAARAQDPARRLLPARLPGGARRSPTPPWCRAGRPSAACWTSWTPGSPGLPLYITEAGYTTATTPYRTEKVTEDQQAEYLSQIYSLPQLRSERVKAVVWFNLQDNANWPAGLLREDLSKKPSYEAFTRAVDDQDGARLTG